MTETELALDDIAAALNRLALVIATLVLILIVLSWSLDDMNLHIHLFGVMLRRAVPTVPTPTLPRTSDTSTVPAPAPAAQKAAKAARREDHAI